MLVLQLCNFATFVTCRQLVDLRTKAQNWKPAGRSFQEVLSGLQRNYDELVWKVEEYMRER